MDIDEGRRLLAAAESGTFEASADLLIWLRTNATALLAELADARRDAGRYRTIRENHQLGAFYNGQQANIALLNGQRDRNRLLISMILRDKAAAAYVSPDHRNLDAAVDAMQAGGGTREAQK